MGQKEIKVNDKQRQKYRMLLNSLHQRLEFFLNMKDYRRPFVRITGI